MNRSIAVSCSLLVMICGMSQLIAAERTRPAVVTALSPEAIRRTETWIKQLDDDDYFVREKATQKLSELGSAGISLLTQAVKTGSPEVAWRAGSALEHIALSGDEASLKAVTSAFEDVMLTARPGLANLIKELADRQHWYRHARAMEQVARHGGQIQVSSDGEGVDLGIIDLAVADELVEEGFAVDMEIDPFRPDVDDMIGAADDATRFRLAGVEPIEISLLDQFKAEAGKAFSPPEVAFPELVDALEAEAGGLRVMEGIAELEPVMEAAVEVVAEEEIEIDGDFQTALTLGKNWKGGDAALSLLKDIRGLQMIKLEESPLTDAAFAHLEKVKELSALYIMGGSFSPEALMKFRRTRPNVSLTARGKGMLGINATGVRIELVQEDSPAHKAGIKKGDVVRRVAGHEVEDFTDITLTLVSRMPGDKIQIEIERGSEVHKLEVQLAERR